MTLIAGGRDGGVASAAGSGGELLGRPMFVAARRVLDGYTLEGSGSSPDQRNSARWRVVLASGRCVRREASADCFSVQVAAERVVIGLVDEVRFAGALVPKRGQRP